MSYEKYFL